MTMLLLATGCTGRPAAAAPGAASVSVPTTITIDGLARTFLLHRPAGLDPTTPVPLVVMLHGGGGNAAAAERSYGWDAAADRDRFVVAYPNGVDGSWAVGGGCCGVAARPGVDDIAFLTRLVDAVDGRQRIDRARVYATGISEGGMMSYRLACDTTAFAAIGPDSATLLGPCPAPHPVSVIHIHGTADTRIRYDGGPGEGVYRIDGPAVPDLNATWRAVDRCGPPSVATAGVVTTSSASCADGRGVELVTVAGAGHQWPGAPCNLRCAGGTADPPSTALDATAVIWQFFAAHPQPRPGA